MGEELTRAIANLTTDHAALRESAAREIYEAGRADAEAAAATWLLHPGLSVLLLDTKREVTVGLAVQHGTFERIWQANGSPRLASVPPEQDAKEFELHFANGVALDILTTRDPAGNGAIARYLAKLGEGIQQVEFRCTDVERASEILRQDLGVASVYPQTRPGADGTRVNFFLVPSPDGGKILIELYER
jgi:hypothetical protein